MAVAPLTAYLAGAVLVLPSAVTDARIGSIADAAFQILSPVRAVVLGVVLTFRRPGSAVGPSLTLLGAAPALTNGVANWGATFSTAHPWPGALAAATVEPGIWVFNLAGFVLLCMTFPDGMLPGRRWRVAPWIALVVAIGVDAVVSFNPAQYVAGGGRLPGHTPVAVPRPVGLALTLLAGAALLAVLATAVGALVVRYRAGGDVVRLQLRWLVLGAGAVPVLLVAGWAAEALGASTSVPYAGFLLAMLVLVPAAVTMAILFHDLFDVDRLLGESVSWVATTAVAAGVFAVTVLGISEVGARAARVGVTRAAFVTALLLIPVHRLIQTAVGRLFDRERTVMLAGLHEFVRRVRDGRAEPEEVEDVLRIALDDPELQVLLRYREPIATSI